MTYVERSAPEADARIAGPERAWIDALGPEQSRSDLKVTGDAKLANALLDALSPVAVADAKVA